MPNLSFDFSTCAIVAAFGFVLCFSLLAIEATEVYALPMSTRAVLSHVCGMFLLISIPCFCWSGSE